MEQMLQCYEKRGAWADGSILPKHQREQQDNYNRRKSCFNSPGVYSYLIDSYDVIFAHTPTRVDGDELYINEFCYSACNGMSLDSTLARALKLSRVLGSCFIVMDSPEEQPDNYEQMIAERSYPYIEIVLPQSVTTLEIDRKGDIIKFGYKCDTEQGTVYRTYTPYQCTETGDNNNNAWEMPVKMPVVPVITSGSSLVSGELPPSPTLDLYQSQKTIAITNSLLDEELHTTCFPLLVIKSNMDPSQIGLGNNNGLHLTGDNDQAYYLSPPSNTIDSKHNHIEKQLSIMIKTHANLITNDFAQSGIAKQYDRSMGAAGLKSIASIMEKIEYKIYKLWCEFFGMVPNPNYTVAYYKSYDLGSISEYIVAASDILGLDWSEETKLAIKNDLLGKYFSGDDELLIPRLILAEQNHVETLPADNTDLPIDNVDNFDGVQ